MMGHEISAAIALWAFTWVWLYYKSLVYRKLLLDYLKVHYPDVHSGTVADLSNKRLIDRIFADAEVVKRQFVQEKTLLSQSVLMDTDARALQRRYKLYLLLMLVCTSFFLIGTVVLVLVAD